MSDAYVDGTYLQSNPTWHAEDSPWKARQILKMIERRGLAPQRVCEVGCGAGGILLQLAEALPEARFDGFEVSPQAFSLCEKHEHPRVRFFLEDFLARAPDETYDLALVIDVFEHLEDYYSFLRALAPRASQTIFHIPLDLSVQSLLRVSPLLDLRKRIGHIHSFTKESALAVLEETGYEIVDHFYTATRLDLPAGGLPARLARWPRKGLFAIRPDFAVRLLGGYSLLVLARPA